MSSESMDFKPVLRALTDLRHLGEDDTFAAVSAMMRGDVDAATIAAFLTAMTMKGESDDELVGAARAMRAHLTPVRHGHARVLDTCGTGGDLADTFNISTCVAFVCAAAGVPVAKHGNRSASSRVGSADVLEAAGIVLDPGLGATEALFERLGYCFMFAPSHHQAMRHAAPVRRALGFRTLFNLLGPLSNPAGATHQLLGIHDPRRLDRMAAVLGRLGARRALVVHGAGGLDEIALSGPSEGVLNDGGVLTRLRIDPAELGLSPAPIEALRGGDAQRNAAIMVELLGGAGGPAADIVALNAGVALWVAEVAPSMSDGVHLARETLARGAALRLLEAYRDGTRAATEGVKA